MAYIDVEPSRKLFLVDDVLITETKIYPFSAFLNRSDVGSLIVNTSALVGSLTAVSVHGPRSTLSTR